MTDSRREKKRCFIKSENILNTLQRCMQRREPLADRDGSSATKRALWHHTVISEGVQHFQKKMASREGIHSKVFQKRKGEVHV